MCLCVCVYVYIYLCRCTCMHVDVHGRVFMWICLCARVRVLWRGVRVDDGTFMWSTPRMRVGLMLLIVPYLYPHQQRQQQGSHYSNHYTWALPTYNTVDVVLTFLRVCKSVVRTKSGHRLAKKVKSHPAGAATTAADAHSTASGRGSCTSLPPLGTPPLPPRGSSLYLTPPYRHADTNTPKDWHTHE